MSLTKVTSRVIQPGSITANSLDPDLYPIFQAYSNATQSVTNGVFTKMTFNVVDVDTHDWWDSTNNRYMPQIAGYYFLNGHAYFGGTQFNLLQAYFYLNGSSNGSVLFYEDRDDTADPVSTTQGGGGSTIMYLNGTTDYVEVVGRNYSSSPTFLAGRRFSVHLLRRA